MAKMKWSDFRVVVDTIASLVGEESIEQADFGSFNWIRVTPQAFQRLSAGRTVEQKIEGGWNTRLFNLPCGAVIRTMIVAPDAVVRSCQVPGEPLAIEPVGAMPQPRVVDTDDVLDDEPNEGSTIISDAEAIAVLAQHTTVPGAISGGKVVAR